MEPGLGLAHVGFTPSSFQSKGGMSGIEAGCLPWAADRGWVAQLMLPPQAPV